VAFKTIQKLSQTYLTLKKWRVDCGKKFIISKTNTGPCQINAWGRHKSDKKMHEKSEMLPVTFVGSLYKTDAVFCSKIADVHVLEFHDVRT